MAYFRLTAAAMGHHKFTLFGDGSVQRDFTYINDVSVTTVDLFENLELTSQQVNDVVNIGGMRPLSMTFLIQLVEEITGNQLRITYEEPNLNDSRITMTDNSYLTTLLGSRKFTPLGFGISQLENWTSQPSIRPSILEWIKSSN